MALTPFSRRDPGLFDPFERQLGVFDPFSNRLGGSWDPFSALRTMDPFAIMEHGPARQMARDVSAVANTRVDWVETPEAHVFKADLPGLKKEEIKIEIEDGRTLKISGERKKEETQESDRWYRVERAQGSFMRSFRLPENAKVDEVNAKVDHGVLTVTVPKTQTEKRDVRAVQIS